MEDSKRNGLDQDSIVGATQMFREHDIDTAFAETSLLPKIAFRK